MRSLALVVLVFVLNLHPLIAGTSAEIGGRFLRELSRVEEAATRSESRAGAPLLQRAATMLSGQLAQVEGSQLREGEREVAPEVWAQLLKDFPQLAQVAEEWQAARRAEYKERTAAACKELEAAARETTAKLGTARQPAELDAVLRSLEEVAARYPYNHGANSWPSWVTCARNLQQVLVFARAWQSVLAAEVAGEKVAAAKALARVNQLGAVPALPSSQLLALLSATARRLGIPSADQAEKTVSEMIAKTMSATTATELDPWIVELRRAQLLWDKFQFEEESAPPLAGVFEAGREFVVRWQEYLVFRAVGNTGRARTILEALARQAETQPLYPRGKLLEAASAVSEDAPVRPVKSSAAEEILAKMKSPDEIDAHLAAFKVAGESDSLRYHTVSEDLGRIRDAAVSLKHGNVAGARVAAMGGFNRHPKVAELRAQLSQKVVAAMLHAEGEAAPKPGESATDLARRLAADAAGKKDWVRLNEILDAPLHTVGLHNVFLPTDAKSVRSFTTALTLEAGGLSDAAVESYTAALSGGSAYLPAEEIRDRLRPLVRWRWLKRPSVIFIILFGGLLIFLFVRSRMNPDEPSSP